MTFEPGEYEQRLEGLRARMQERDIDAVLLGTGMNLKYFSGYPSPAINVARPFFAVLPLEGEPSFITHTAHAFEAERYSWIKEIRQYEQLSSCPTQVIGEVLREAGAKRVGLELGFEQTSSLSPLEFQRLRESLRSCQVEDVSAEIWGLRMRKSEAEIGCMRKACGITSAAYQAVLPAVCEGALESQIYACMRARLTNGDVGDLFLLITSGSGNYDLVTKMPEERAIVAGDMVWMDAGCTVSGYWSDFSRAATAGPATDAQRRAQDAICSITERTLQMIRPGARASDVARFALNAIEQLPFAVTSNIAALAGRIGHGVGLNLTEPPHLGLHDETVLQEGMVVSVEPGVATAYGTFHIEENVLITRDGCEVLSDCSRELRFA